MIHNQIKPCVSNSLKAKVNHIYQKNVLLYVSEHSIYLVIGLLLNNILFELVHI